MAEATSSKRSQGAQQNDSEFGPLNAVAGNRSARTALPSIIASAPGAVVLTTAAPPLAVAEHNCEAAGYCPADCWRDFCRKLGVPVVEVQRGLCVARAADVDAALARLGRPLPRKVKQASGPANDAAESREQRLAASGLKRKAVGQ